MNELYQAFISYSHKDIKYVDKLHHSLENMKLPVFEGDKRNLFPIFRDADELPTSSNLADSLNTSLAKSRYLIVVVSSASIDSEWVQKEVRFYYEMFGAKKIIFIILEHDLQNKVSQDNPVIQAMQNKDSIVLDIELLSLKDITIKIASIITAHSEDKVKRHRNINKIKSWGVGVIAISTLIFILMGVAVGAAIYKGLGLAISSYKEVHNVSTFTAIYEIFTADDQEANDEQPAPCEQYLIDASKYQEGIDNSLKYGQRSLEALNNGSDDIAGLIPVVDGLISDFNRRELCADDSLKEKYDVERKHVFALFDKLVAAAEKHGYILR